MHIFSRNSDTRCDGLATESEYPDLLKLPYPEVSLALYEEDIMDRGGRRSGFDRRQLDILLEAGNQRTAKPDRRSGIDRRATWSYDPNDPNERRTSFQINSGR